MMIRLGRPAALTLLMMALWSLYVWRLERSAIRLTPRGLGWSQIARGANADGVVRDVLVLQLPGLDRSEPRTIVMRRAPAQTASPGATLAIDGLAAGALRLANESVFSLPPAAVPGARVELRPMEKGQALTLTEIEIAPKRARSIRWLAALSLFGMLLIIAWRARRFAMAAVLSLSAVALWMISRVPLLTALSWPSALWVDATPLLVVTAASMLAYRMPAAERRHSMRIVGLGLLFAFGFWIRSAFLFSAGSWDTEYWKAWMLRAAEHGVAQVYGGPESVPPGEFWAQFTGHAPRFEARFHGRDFVVDYPPLAMALWRSSHWVVSRLAPQLDAGEAQNVAVKLPALAGDLIAIGVLFWALPGRPKRATVLAALYWALPLSWLSSGVLGFLDGALAPITVAAVIAAARHRAVLAGILLAIACLIKPTAGMVAPAMAIALWPNARAIARMLAVSIACGIAAAIPYLLAGTGATALIHVYRILFQERLSGGFPNPWWLLGHIYSVVMQGKPLAGPVAFVPISVVDLPVRSVGTLLFMMAAAWILRQQRRGGGAQGACLAAALLVWAYAVCAIGVHENHPHAVVLLLLATGLRARALKAIFAAASGIYLFTMLSLSGLGRFYGPRYAFFDPWLARANSLRMALGFDLTLLLTLCGIVMAYALWRVLPGCFEATAVDSETSAC